MTEDPFPITDLRKVQCRLARQGTLLWTVLDAPPGNILDSEMVASLRRVVQAAKALPALRLMVFTGAGSHFSYGASVPEHLPGRVGPMLENFHGLIGDLIDCDLPLLSLVRGRCLGGGLELAAFCDRVVVEEEASLGQPEIRLGVFAPLGSLLLPWRCGARGAQLAFTGKTIDAGEAFVLGLADQVVKKGEGEAAVERWLEQELLPLSASSTRYARRAARWSLNRLLREGLPAMERLYLDDLMKTRDAVEGLNAFMEKRKPEWTHD